MTPHRFPDFFVVGAPRCGTTALCRYLDKHPQICFSKPKETHYFSRLPADWIPERLERDYYQRYFPHLNDGHRRIGEGSVSYLYAPGVIERIESLNPEVRMIALLRNPIDVLPSYHLRMLFILTEDVADLANAWSLQAVRARGERIPPTCIDPRLLLYREVVRFGAQVDRLYRAVGRDRALVLLHEDLVADPLGTYRRALEFIGVDYDGRTEFKRKLPSRRYRHRWLQRLFYAPPKPARAALETVRVRAKQKRRPGKRSLVNRIARWNQMDGPPARMSEALRAEIAAALADDVMLLGRLLGRDLSHWLDEPVDAASNGQRIAHGAHVAHSR